MAVATVDVYLSTPPRLQLWTDVVSEVGDEFGRSLQRLALFPRQMELLEERPDEEEDDDVRFLLGPPVSRAV